MNEDLKIEMDKVRCFRSDKAMTVEEHDDWLEKCEFFNESLKLVAEDRADQYGTGLQNMERIADLWSSYLGRQITPRDVCAMMILHKVSRISQKKDEPAHDSWIDIAGYASLGDSVGK